MVDWSIRYASEKEAFKIKFWDREDNWNKLLKNSPYQNVAEPAPSFTILEPQYQCELCGTKRYPENVFRDRSSGYYYCKSHYDTPKVDTYRVINQQGDITGQGNDTKEISKKKRKEVSKVYNSEKKRKEKEEKRKVNNSGLKDFSKDTRPLDAIFAKRYAARKICPWCKGPGDDLKTASFDPETGRGTTRPTFKGQFTYWEAPAVINASTVEFHNENCHDGKCHKDCPINKLFNDMVANTDEAARGVLNDPLNNSLFGRHTNAQRRGIEQYFQSVYPKEPLGKVCEDHGCKAESVPFDYEDALDGTPKKGKYLSVKHDESCPNKQLGEVSHPVLRGACLHCGEDITPDQPSIRWKIPRGQDNSFVSDTKPGGKYVKLVDRFPAAAGLKDIDAWEGKYSKQQDTFRSRGVNQRPKGSPPNPEFESQPPLTGGTPIKLGPNGGIILNNSGGRHEDMLQVMPFHHTDECSSIKIIQSQCPAHQGRAATDYEVGHGGGIHFVNQQGEKPLAKVTQNFYIQEPTANKDIKEAKFRDNFF